VGSGNSASPTFRFFVLLFLLSAVPVSSLPGELAWGQSGNTPQLADRSGALFNDPVFTPSVLTTAFHMTPTIFYGGDVLHPGEFDFDLAFGTFGTNFWKAEKQILLEEDSDASFYTDLGWRFGLSDGIGPLRIPSEIYTQLPFYFTSGGFSSSILQEGNFHPVGHVDEDFALGKWIWGLRFGLVQETDRRPSLVLSGSVGLPVDDSLASDGTDFDLRLTTQKHFGRGLAGSLYGGFLFPGNGKSAIEDLGIESEESVSYFGILTEANVAQLRGDPNPGRVWLHFGFSWRDALYDFGAHGPDYSEEETKLTAGATFDLGWMGCMLGRPQGMMGCSYTLFGGPEQSEAELVTRLRFPFRFGKGWPCDGT